MWIIHIRAKYSMSSLRTSACPQSSCKAFCQMSFRSATQVFHCSLQWCRSSGRLAFSSVWVLLMPVDSSNNLLTHSCCFCVGELERFERKLKDLRDRLHRLTSFQIPCMHGKMFSNLLTFDGMQVNWTYMYQFCWLFAQVHGFPSFSGNGYACASRVYQAAFSPTTQPVTSLTCYHTTVATLLPCYTITTAKHWYSQLW